MQNIRKGTNASGMRRYNERLILSAVRRSGGASKAELARATALSPQAVVRIVDQLADKGFLVQTGRRKGGMGQPALVYRINGARGYTVGLEVGRASLTLVLLDFDGQRKAIRHRHIPFPTIDLVVDETNRFLGDALTAEPQPVLESLMGVGIAMPWFLGEWGDELAITDDQASEWRRDDVAERLAAGISWPLFFENDGNAAALAQLLCGAGVDLQNFLYVNLGTFVGGGLVLGGNVIQGRHGNAGALASMPIGMKGASDFLIHHASLYSLGANPEPDAVTAWTDRCADALGFAVISANSLLDLEAVIIDGTSQDVVARVGAALERRLHRDVPPDFFRPAIRCGEFGTSAAATGAGLLPLHARFTPDLGVLFKRSAEA
jgi:predicted NBD/HSP70 family sugar kinase